MISHQFVHINNEYIWILNSSSFSIFLRPALSLTLFSWQLIFSPGLVFRLHALYLTWKLSLISVYFPKQNCDQLKKKIFTDIEWINFQFPRNLAPSCEDANNAWRPSLPQYRQSVTPASPLLTSHLRMLRLIGFLRDSFLAAFSPASLLLSPVLVSLSLDSGSRSFRFLKRYYTDRTNQENRPD